MRPRPCSGPCATPPCRGICGSASSWAGTRPALEKVRALARNPCPGPPRWPWTWTTWPPAWPRPIWPSARAGRHDVGALRPRPALDHRGDRRQPVRDRGGDGPRRGRARPGRAARPRFARALGEAVARRATPPASRRCQQAAAGICDGDGAGRVIVARLARASVSFRAATRADSRRVWEWRRAPSVFAPLRLAGEEHALRPPMIAWFRHALERNDEDRTITHRGQPSALAVTAAEPHTRPGSAELALVWPEREHVFKDSRLAPASRVLAFNKPGISLHKAHFGKKACFTSITRGGNLRGTQPPPACSSARAMWDEIADGFLTCHR